MRRGAVAVLDVLGFKGIWKRHAAVDVVATLQRLAETTAQQTRSIETAARDEDSAFIETMRAAFISDTIVFGLTTKEAARVNASEAHRELGIELTDADLGGEAVRLVAQFAAAVQRSALLEEPAFALRGCIAYGDFGMTDRFIIGEAVDEAASLHEEADGAFITLAPSAAVFKQPEQWWSEYPVTYYEVPLKASGPTRMGVVASNDGRQLLLQVDDNYFCRSTAVLTVHARLRPGVPGRPRGSRSPDGHGRTGQVAEEESGRRKDDRDGGCGGRHERAQRVRLETGSAA
jgi:hypothetical protein